MSKTRVVIRPVSCRTVLKAIQVREGSLFTFEIEVFICMTPTKILDP